MTCACRPWCSAGGVASGEAHYPSCVEIFPLTWPTLSFVPSGAAALAREQAFMSRSSCSNNFPRTTRPSGSTRRSAWPLLRACQHSAQARVVIPPQRGG
eukprot:scaffold129611_cov33-Tisochrysis_lutea.AAC.3